MAPLTSYETGMCQYKGRPCTNPRAERRDGTRLVYCALHRANANRDQRRHVQRKKLLRVGHVHDTMTYLIAALRPATTKHSVLWTSTVAHEYGPHGAVVVAWMPACGQKGDGAFNPGMLYSLEPHTIPQVAHDRSCGSDSATSGPRDEPSAHIKPIPFVATNDFAEASLEDFTDDIAFWFGE